MCLMRLLNRFLSWLLIEKNPNRMYRTREVFTFSSSGPGGEPYPHEVQAFVAKLFEILNPDAPLAIVFSRDTVLQSEQAARLHHVHWDPNSHKTDILLYRVARDFVQDAQYLLGNFEPEQLFNVPSSEPEVAQQIAYYHSFDMPQWYSNEFIAAYSPVVIQESWRVELWEYVGHRVEDD